MKRYELRVIEWLVRLYFLKGYCMKRYELRIIEWLDSCVQDVQVSHHNFPKPMVVTSVGFVVEETEEYITISRDDMGNGEFRGLVSIPRIAIQN